MSENTESDVVLRCPKCAAAVPRDQSEGWCTKCGEPLPAEVTAVLPALQALAARAGVEIGATRVASNIGTGSNGSSGVAGGLLIGALVGTFIGFVLRPAVPIIGQLPLGIVITRGANLTGLDSILIPMAQQSFNYLLLGTLLGAGMGALAGLALRSKASSPTVAVAIPSPSLPVSAAPHPSGIPTAATHSAVDLNQRTVRLGDSREMVQAALGTPERVIDLGAKAVFMYTDLKITFTDGRVVDVQ